MARPRKPNLWARIVDQLVFDPEQPNFTAEDFFVMALLPETEWPESVKEAHWIWTGTSVSNLKHGSNTSYPIIRIAGHLESVRKVFMAMNCYEFPFNASPTPICPEPNCINPLHMKWTERRSRLESRAADPDTFTAQQELAEEIERLMTIHRVTTKEELFALSELQDWSQPEIAAAFNTLNARALR
jgi:hypothetical protein